MDDENMQNYLVDVWRCEKVRMFDSGIIDPKMQLEEQNILDIETAQCEYDDNQPDPVDDDDNYDDDIFGRCDIDGKESNSNHDIISKPLHFDASIKKR